MPYDLVAHAFSFRSSKSASFVVKGACNLLRPVVRLRQNPLFNRLLIR